MCSVYKYTGELHVGCKTSACIVTRLCRRSLSRCQSDVLTYIGNNSLYLQTTHCGHALHTDVLYSVEFVVVIDRDCKLVCAYVPANVFVGDEGRIQDFSCWLGSGRSYKRATCEFISTTGLYGGMVPEKIISL